MRLGSGGRPDASEISSFTVGSGTDCADAADFADLDNFSAVFSSSFRFLFRNKMWSTDSESRLALSLVTVRPAAENKRSLGTLVAGMDKYFLASNAILGKRFSYDRHHSKGLPTRTGSF